MQSLPNKPGVVFAMRYPDDTGYVWNYIAGIRDRVSEHLLDRAVPYIAFPRLTGNPSYAPRNLNPVEADFYDNSPAGRAALTAFVHQHNVKVVVFMSALPQTVCCDLFNKLGVRTLNTEDDSYDPTQRDGLAKRLTKFVLRRVLKRQSHDLHLANSSSQRHFLLNYAMLPPDRVVLMTNAIDCGHFHPDDRAAACAQTGLDPDRLWILAVSQARSEKRVEKLLDMVQGLVKARPKARIGFVYVGDGPALAQYKSHAEQLGVQDYCVFAGRQNDVRPYYRAANLFVHGACLESFGLAVVEAMACGIPVVACAAAGPSETIVDGVTGALVPLNDFEQFERAVLRYIDDLELLRTHGNNARAHVVATYNVVRHCNEFAGHIARFL
jgi:glycosyltransferase involved in cell wall biosynthesis